MYTERLLYEVNLTVWLVFYGNIYLKKVPYFWVLYFFFFFFEIKNSYVQNYVQKQEVKSIHLT